MDTTASEKQGPKKRTVGDAPLTAVNTTPANNLTNYSAANNNLSGVNGNNGPSSLSHAAMSERLSVSAVANTTGNIASMVGSGSVMSESERCVRAHVDMCVRVQACTCVYACNVCRCICSILDCVKIHV